MPLVPFQSDAQKERIGRLHGALQYRNRVVVDVANPLVEARDRAAEALRGAMLEIGVPDNQQVVMKDGGLLYADEGQVWDEKAGAFVNKAPEPEPVEVSPVRDEVSERP